METAVSSTPHSGLLPYEAIPLLPGGVRFLGHNPEIRSDRLGFARRVLEQGGSIGRVGAPFANVCFVNDPQLIHELLVERASSFDKSAMVRFTLYPLAGEGLFTSNGELWKRQRKLMAPMFHQQALQGYATDMMACTLRTMEPWQDGSTIPFARETTRLTMAVAGKTLFDSDTFSDADTIGEALTTTLEWTSNAAGGLLSISHLLARVGLQVASERTPVGANTLRTLASHLEGPLFYPGAEGKHFARALAVLDDRVARMIQERRSQGLSRNDLLTRLLAAQDEDGARMSDKQVRDEVLTLFVAGHETTATGLAWTMQSLCENPELYAAAEREADALANDPTVEDLPRLGFLLRAFKEALRIYPPVYFFGRTSNEETTLGGYRLPRFTNVLILPWALHRRPQEWPRAEQFDPDRFLPENEAARPRTAWIPFSAGPRICIGNHFSMMEAQLVLAAMLRRWRFEPLGHEVPDPGATLRPRGTMPMRIFRRNKAH